MDARAIMRNGLRDQNPGLVQLLGLSPLLAVSTTVANALGLGLATLAVLVTSNMLAELAGPWLPLEVRLAVFVVLIAGSVTAVELSLSAWWPGMHAALGIFLPLIVTNCLVLARAESFASRATPGRAMLDGFAMGLGFLLVLLALGGTRELAGRGSLGADLHLSTPIIQLPTGPSLWVGALRERVRATIQEVIDEELRDALGVESYGRSEARRGYRNGTQDRTLTSEYGRVETMCAPGPAATGQWHDP